MKGVDLDVPMGSTYCLAGPNGAGKTTFIRIASTVILPSSGEILVMGFDAVRETWKVRKRVALMPQEGRPFNSTLTVYEAVYYYLLARGMGFTTARREARRVLEDLDLWKYRDRLILTLSGGLARRTLLAMVLGTGADLVFLDEPTTGLDPEARRTTWGYVKRLAKEGQTIVFSTHQLAEAETVADRVALIDNGVIVGEGEPSALVETLPYRYKVVASPHKLPDWLGEADVVVRYYGGLVYVYVERVEEALKIASEIVMEGGSAQVKHVDLEDYFIEKTSSGGRRL